MSGLESGVTAKDLSYVRRPLYQRRRAPPGDRDRCRRHAEGPKPAIWGSGTTACASDSKHFGAWDRISPRNGTCVIAGVAS
jgi:TnpA family transposase